MANDIPLNPGTGGKTLASKDIAGLQYQRFIQVNPNDGADAIPPSYPQSALLLNAATTTGAGSAAQLKMGKRTYSLVLTGTSGTYSATVNVEVANDGSNWLPIYQFVLSGTSTKADGVTLDERWLSVRGNVVAISGTGAAVSLIASC